VIRRKKEKAPQSEGTVSPDETSGERRERRELPPELIAEAAAHPGGSVYEIDGFMVPDPYGYVPPEAIVGEFVVGPDGVATGDYIHNPRYGPIQDDYGLLDSPDVWLGWLPGPSPAEVLRRALEDKLADQVTGSRIEWFKVTEDPAFRTGGPGSPEDEDHIRMTVRRAGVAVPFALAVATPEPQRYILTGVFTWVATHLDTPWQRRDGVWLDLNMNTHAEAAEALNRRIYEMGAD
jgi:hypothetical protein